MSKCDNFFGMVLPSSSLLILDFIYAANTIIESANTAVSVTTFETIVYISKVWIRLYHYWSSKRGHKPIKCDNAVRLTNHETNKSVNVAVEVVEIRSEPYHTVIFLSYVFFC